MPSNHVNRVLRESEAVSKRMRDSKKEIEGLRAEYERLIEKGLQAGASNITDTDKEKEREKERENHGTARTVDSAQPSCSNATGINQNARVSVKRKPPDSSRTTMEQGSPPKVRHYNVEDAREYMRKQRALRLQQQKQQRDRDNAFDIKKKKLLELHQKSLQIVARNRQRSKSRDKLKSAEPESVVPAPALATASAPVQSEILLTKQLTQANIKPLKPHLNFHANPNITYRAPKTEEVKYVKSSAKSDDAKIKAATLIQAYFRGHIQRKVYNGAKQQILTAHESQKTSMTAVEQLENQAIAQTVTEETIEEHPKEPEKKIPDWLLPEPAYHPYNFINSVKRKLNIALNSPITTCDVAIQSSLSEHCPPNEENTPQRYKEVKEKIELSLSSKKSDMEINAKIQRSLDAIRSIQREELGSGLSKRVYKNVQNGHDKGFLDLDAKRLEKLKLHSDHSDSDTSKNIPDISMESRYKSSSALSASASGTSVSDSATSVFKHPKEPPPKPKRLSRHELHSSAKSSVSVCKESQKFAQHAEVHLDEYRLNINADRLKNIQLKRSLSNVPSHDNTMLHYEESRQIHSRKSKSQTSIENETTSSNNTSSASIKTVSNRSHSVNSHTNLDMPQSSKTSQVVSQSLTQVKTDDNFQQSHSRNKSKTNSYSVNPENSQKSKSLPATNIHSQDIPYSNSRGSSHSRRNSNISGNISRYTKSFDTYATESSKHNTATNPVAKSVEVQPDETSDIPENLLSFRQYMKEIDDTQKIMHTPFQPRLQAPVRKLNAEKRLQEVISKVNLLDKSLNGNEQPKTSAENLINIENNPKRTEIHQQKTELCRSLGNGEQSLGNKAEITHHEEVVEDQAEAKYTAENEVMPLKEEKLVPPNVNLIVMKCTDDNKENKQSARSSTDTLANGGGVNQIHVKFQAEIHLLNDFNKSLQQIVDIEKSMSDLQAKYNLQPTIRETKDTQTSAMSQSMTKSPTTNASKSSIIEKSINFSRGSDIGIDKDDKIIVLHQNKNMMMESSRSNSTLNISELTLNNSMQSTQNAITLNTSAVNATDMDVTTGDNEKQLNKVSSVEISVGMYDQLISDEEARIEHMKAVLKVREKTLLDRTKGELTLLEIQKKHLLGTGKLHEASLLKKKQRGIVLKLQEEKNEMQRLREAHKAASKERKTKLKEQRALIKAQLGGPHLVTRIRRASERRSSGPVKVYQSEYYQSETSVSRKSSASESVVYASRSASIISRVADAAGAGDGAVRREPTAVASHTEMAKRSLQMREAALQRRRKEAEDLLRWHQKLVREERKIAELEMAASNVINQAPAADGDKYTFKGAGVPTLWKDVKANQKSDAKSKSIESGGEASMSSKLYSTDFDSDKEDGVLGKGIQQSESTLNEIIHNINNISDEISELYKLSTMQKSANKLDDSPIDSDCLSTDHSVSQSASKSHSSKASIISKPKSVPEASVKPEESIVTTKLNSGSTSKPDVKSETSSNSKNSFIRIQSNELSLHEVQLPERAETEEDISSIKSEVLSEEPKSNISIALTSIQNEVEDLGQEISETSETLKETQIEENKTDISDERNEADTVPSMKSRSILEDNILSVASAGIESVKSALVASDESNHKSEVHGVIDDVQNVSHISIDIADEQIISTIDISVESNEQADLMPSSKDVSVAAEHFTSALESLDEDKMILELNKPDISIASILPSSQDGVETEYEQSHIKSEINTENEVDLISNHQDDEESEQSLSISDKISAIIEDQVDSNLEESIEHLQDDIEEVLSELKEVVKDDLAVQIEDEASLDSPVNSYESKTSFDEEESLPIIGVKIEERKHESVNDEPDCLESPKDLDSESTKGSLDENDSSITDECEVEPEVESSFKKSVDVKKRVSEILADANLNASIEEKSPRLPDIYVTTYDVISPDNSPELGSPVDSSKAKSKDIYGIGNEAQELLRKQLAIEQEIKQIERQQKEQLPYIFVREIPNKPPPPYTPPVQQPSSIVPATPVQIEEIAPHLAEIFHRGFIEKTLEYVTFPDTKLDQLENVDKSCAEFLFDIAKDYAMQHYKQFVQPDEKAPSWMRHNKPKSFKRPHSQNSLEILLGKKLKELFAFEKSDCQETMIIKWSRKKRDHVDELLVVESQSEEAEWTNYDQDELIVKEDVTTSMLDMLIEETAMCLQDIFAARQATQSHC